MTSIEHSNDQIEHLKSLHTSAIDARNGYQEALKDAEGRGLTPLFADMIAVHTANAQELETTLSAAGEKADQSGSFMTLVHRAIFSVRSLFDELDEDVLPGLIDGEQRNVSHYDEALKQTGLAAELATLLTTQRARLVEKIEDMKSWKTTAPA